MREGIPSTSAPNPSDQEVIDETLRRVQDAAARVAARILPGPTPSIEQLRAGPLGRDLARLALVARGQAQEPREEVLTAVEGILQLLFWPAAAEDYIVPRAFWETDLGRILAGAKLRAYSPQELVTIGEAARSLGVARPTIYRWMDEGKLDAVRDTAEGRMLVVRDDVTRLRAEAPERASTD